MFYMTGLNDAFNEFYSKLQAMTDVQSGETNSQTNVFSVDFFFLFY